MSASQMLATGDMQQGNAETRLIEVFSLIEKSDIQQALQQAEALTRDYPNFHLAHLVRADLLKLRYQPNASLDGPAAGQVNTASSQLAALRTETQARLSALRERPPAGNVPQQILALGTQSRHVIAVDASRSRLYLFENLAKTTEQSASPSPPSMRLLGDFFISVGKSGINKRVEGDGRTPLGVYYITSVRDKKSLPEFYGSGALPINYPNAVDVQRGRTGSGIWLHGTPPQQYVRAPLASDGCVVLSNPDMERLLALVEPRTTPVVIAEQLKWVPPGALSEVADSSARVLSSWQKARSQATPDEFAQWFDRSALTKVGFAYKTNGAELLAHPSAQLGISNVSLLKWQDPNESMVATFEETANGQATGVVRRQYWTKQAEGWRLLQDTVMSGTPSAALKRPAPPPPPPPVVVASVPESPPPAPASRVAASTPAPAAAAPAPARAPIAAPPAQARAPVSAPAASTASAAPAAQTAQQTKQVQQAVEAWARAWSQKNMPQYLGAYAPSFEPPDGLSRKAWEMERLNRIVSKSKISVNLSKMAIQVHGNTATVVFVQSYKADQLVVSGRKTLKMVKRGDRWMISHESVGSR